MFTSVTSKAAATKYCNGILSDFIVSVMPFSSYTHENGSSDLKTSTLLKISGRAKI